ncbi:hypothetical protein SUNI508_10937 [Seiridium unicorne]|uniref:Dynamin GTPase domain-containing protein n=1 Tax=Seiridium unicorne TaxID=138068 RepID=A0ABR2UJH5_9PEZI
MEVKNIHNGARGRGGTPCSSQAPDTTMHHNLIDIGTKLKACNDTLGELQQLGIQHVAQLPELVMTEDMLRWAQIAVLNPNNPADMYIPGEGVYTGEFTLQSAAEEIDAQFSPNIVALEMKGPNLPDLSFYDLPGVFYTPAREDNEYLVQVVRNLSSHYIRRPETIILWALPMNNDPETSISLGLIREARALDRAAGVMTKADMLCFEDTAQWAIANGFGIVALLPYLTKLIYGCCLRKESAKMEEIKI